MHVASQPMVRIAVTAVRASSARMAHVSVAAASVLASLVLVACGGRDGNRPLSPSNAAPFAQKQRTLTPAEYPAMRKFILLDSASAETAGPVCDALEGAPNTPVIRAAHNFCVRTVSIKTATQQLRAAMASECGLGSGDYACAARVLRRYRDRLVTLKEVLITYDRDIEAAIADGPCRDVLIPAERIDRFVDLFDEFISRFDNAVDKLELERDPEALEGLDDFHLDVDNEDDDPTPCRPS